MLLTAQHQDFPFLTCEDRGLILTTILLSGAQPITRRSAKVSVPHSFYV